jgi:hypothetical protein
MWVWWETSKHVGVINIYIYIYMCVCVCVCVWERERERYLGTWSVTINYLTFCFSLLLMPRELCDDETSSWLIIRHDCRSQWPRGLWRGCATTHLLRLWVRDPLKARMFVWCEYCVCHVEVSASGWSLVQRIPTECGVSECDREA